MAAAHHEPIPIHHIDDYPADEQAELKDTTRALVAVTERISRLARTRLDTDAVPVIELHALDKREDGEVGSDELPEPSAEDDAHHIEELAESIRRIIAETGDMGMAVDEFQQAANGANLNLSSEAVMQALIFGFEDNKFSIRDLDDRIVALATPVTSELQDA